MKRLLVIGGSMLQLPAIQKAKKMGLYVGVADYDPSAIGVPLADEYFNVSTIDEEGIYQAAKDFKADGIITLATDMPVRALAYACERMGLVGVSYDTALKATDKGKMMEAFDAYEVNHPLYQVVSEKSLKSQKLMTFPLVTKPTNSSGSRGVMLVHNQKELESALEYSSEFSLDGDVIIEEYMQGPEVSVEIMVSEGIPVVLQITDKLTTGAPHFVEMGHSQPSTLSEEEKNAICGLAKKAVQSIGIENGPAHVEIILTKQGPKMVELGARMGGDYITTHLVPLSTGIDMVENTIKIALGEKPDLRPKKAGGAAIRYFSAERGTVHKIGGIENARKIPGVYEISLSKKIGDEVGEIGSSRDRVGFVIAQAKTAQKAIQICESVMDTVQIEVSSCNV